MIAELESAPQLISGEGALYLPTCIIYPELGLTCRDLLMKHAYQRGRGSLLARPEGEGAFLGKFPASQWEFA